MAAKPNPAEVARIILKIAVSDLKLRPNNYIPDQALKTRFQTSGGHWDDIAGGLKYATNCGWLRYDNDKDAFFLTDEGFAAA